MSAWQVLVLKFYFVSLPTYWGRIWKFYPSSLSHHHHVLRFYALVKILRFYKQGWKYLVFPRVQDFFHGSKIRMDAKLRSEKTLFVCCLCTWGTEALVSEFGDNAINYVPVKSQTGTIPNKTKYSRLRLSYEVR